MEPTTEPTPAPKVPSYWSLVLNNKKANLGLFAFLAILLTLAFTIVRPGEGRWLFASIAVGAPLLLMLGIPAIKYFSLKKNGKDVFQ